MASSVRRTATPRSAEERVRGGAIHRLDAHQPASFTSLRLNVSTTAK